MRVNTWKDRLKRAVKTGEPFYVTHAEWTQIKVEVEMAHPFEFYDAMSHQFAGVDVVIDDARAQTYELNEEWLKGHWLTDADGVLHWQPSLFEDLSGQAGGNER